ncbi:MAG: hypothetical protein RR844_03660 [Clostridium sp.]
MFMDRRELKNALNLYKIINKETRLNKIILFAIPLFLFIVDFMGVWTQVFNYNDQITYFSLNTYSQYALFMSLAFFVGTAFMYRTLNKEHEVLPQTNKSRFLSIALFMYSLLLKLSVFALVLYFIQYGFISIVAGFTGNVHFAYDFSLSFVISGFIVNFIYGSLLLALVLLIGALDRKWSLYFRASFLAIIPILLFNNLFLGKGLMEFISFWTKESSVIVFVVKAAGLWIVLSGLAWLINANTVYFKNANAKFSKASIAVICCIIALMVMAPMFLFGGFTYHTGYNQEVSVTENERLDYSSRFITLPLDGSHLKKGDTIKVVTNCNFEDNMMCIIDLNADQTDDEINFYGFEGKVDGLEISYDLPENMHNEININAFINPKITASLEGTTLYLNYEYDKNQKVLYLSPYGLMGQFEAFKDKNYFKDFIGTSGGSNYGNVYILPEDGIKISPLH